MTEANTQTTVVSPNAGADLATGQQSGASGGVAGESNTTTVGAGDAIASTSKTITFDPQKPETFSDLYTALGRPDKADGYELKLPETVKSDDPLLNGFKKAAFEAGLGTKQAAALLEWFSGESTKTAQEIAQKSVEQQNVLKKEWGAKWDANVATAQRAVQFSGVEAETIEQIQTVLGYDKTMKLFAKFGEPLKEGAFLNGGNNGIGFSSPEAARAEIQRLNNDAEFAKKILSGDKASVERQAQLFKLAYS